MVLTLYIVTCSIAVLLSAIGWIVPAVILGSLAVCLMVRHELRALVRRARPVKAPRPVSYR